MIVTTTYIAENKKERKGLMLMNATLEDAGLDVEFVDEHNDARTNGLVRATLALKESRRSRRSNQEPKVPQE